MEALKLAQTSNKNRHSMKFDTTYADNREVLTDPKRRALL